METKTKTGKNIYQKLIEIRKQVPYIQKAEQGHNYNYVGSSTVLAAVREKMDELGLMLFPRVLDSKVTVSHVDNKDAKGNVKRTQTFFTELQMEFVWVDSETTDSISIPFYGQGIDTGGEKGVGKALTYAEKYFLLKQFNIATDRDDPDAFQEKTDNSTPKFIKKPQINELTKMLKELAEIRNTSVENYLLALNINNMERITVQQFPEIRNKLSDWLKESKRSLAAVQKAKDAKKEEASKQTPPKEEKPALLEQEKTTEVQEVEKQKQVSEKPLKEESKEEVKKEEIEQVKEEAKEEINDQSSNVVENNFVVEGEIDKLVFKVRKNPKTGEEIPYGQIGLKATDGKTYLVVAYGQEKIDLLDEIEGVVKMAITPMKNNSAYYTLEELREGGAA